MATWSQLTALKDYLGNTVDGCFNLDSPSTYCVAPDDSDTFYIENISKQGNVIGITTSCGDLQMSFEGEITRSAPVPRDALPLSLERRIFIPAGQKIVWRYIPEGTDTIWFFNETAGLFNAVILTCPDQFQDEE